MRRLLREFAKWSKYFWNYLFIVLYNPERKWINVDGLAMKAHYSKTNLYNFLSCKVPISEDVFYDLCEAIGLNVKEKSEYVLKSAYIAIELIFHSHDTDNLLSTSSKKRNERIEQLSTYLDEQYAVEEDRMYQEEEYFEEKILTEFEVLSEQELNFLYKVIEILPQTFYGHIEVFLRAYLELNDNGQTVFREALKEQKSNKTDQYQDETAEFLRKISAVGEQDILSDISPQMLSDLLSEKHPGYWDCDFARTLVLFTKLDDKAWETLILFHSLIQENKNVKIQDRVDFKDGVLLLLDWLWCIPSLRINNDFKENLL